MRKLMQWTGIIGGGFIAAALALVIYLGQNRFVVIADTGNVPVSSEFYGEGYAEPLPGQRLLLKEDESLGMSLRIPLEASIGPGNITLENQYMGRRLVLFLRGAAGLFYESSEITGCTKALQGASYAAESEGIRLYLQFSALYEFESIFESGCLRVNLYKPAERYERIVILDAQPLPDMSGEESDALYQIAEKAGALLENEGIRVYTASGQGKALAEDEKLRLVEETGADFYLGLTFDRTKDREEFGSYVCYNSLYFRPTMTNGTFADIMERELVTAISGKANGLVEKEDGILGELSIPALIVCPGYLSHETEGYLLLQDAYQDKIAAGICQGVLKGMEAYEK